MSDELRDLDHLGVLVDVRCGQHFEVVARVAVWCDADGVTYSDHPPFIALQYERAYEAGRRKLAGEAYRTWRVVGTGERRIPLHEAPETVDAWCSKCRSGKAVSVPRLRRAVAAKKSTIRV